MNLRCLELYCAYSISFNSSNVGELFWSWILKDCIKVQEKKKESCCLGFPSSTKREIRHFHVVVVKRRLRNVQKIKSVMHVQSCCFANINLLLLCRSRCRRRRRCLSSRLSVQDTGSRGDVFVVRISKPVENLWKNRLFWSRYGFVTHSIDRKPRDWGLARSALFFTRHFVPRSPFGRRAVRQRGYGLRLLIFKSRSGSDKKRRNLLQ